MSWLQQSLPARTSFSDSRSVQKSIFFPFFGSIVSTLQVNRVRVAKLIIHSTWVVPFPLRIERHISGARQCILHALRAKSPELVREAQVEVVLKPGLVCPEMLHWVEGLNHVFFAITPVLGIERQISQVDQQVLRPVLNIFPSG